MQNSEFGVKAQTAISKMLFSILGIVIFAVSYFAGNMVISHASGPDAQLLSSGKAIYYISASNTATQANAYTTYSIRSKGQAAAMPNASGGYDVLIDSADIYNLAKELNDTSDRLQALTGFATP